MGKADSLSRRLDWKVDMGKDNEDEMLVKPEWLKVRRTEVVEIIVDGVDLLEEVKKSKVKDDEVVRVVEEIKRVGVRMLRDKKWREVDGIMYKEEKVYIPKDKKLRVEIIRLYLSGTCGAGAELPWNGRDLTTKVGEQPWPQLVHCASIYCRVCGCIFQENGIVARSFREEWYRLIGVRIEQGEDVNDFNL